MVTSAPELSHVFIKTDRAIGPRTKHNKTLFRQCLGNAKIHSPKPIMSSEELACKLIKMGITPLKRQSISIYAQ